MNVTARNYDLYYFFCCVFGVHCFVEITWPSSGLWSSSCDTPFYSSFRVFRCLCDNSAAAAWQWHFISDFHSSSLLCAHSLRSPRFDAMKHESRTRKIGVKDDDEEEEAEVFKWMTVLSRRRLCRRWFTREKRKKNSILIQKRYLRPRFCSPFSHRTSAYERLLHPNM